VDPYFCAATIVFGEEGKNKKQKTKKQREKKKDCLFLVHVWAFEESKASLLPVPTI